MWPAPVNRVVPLLLCLVGALLLYIYVQHARMSGLSSQNSELRAKIDVQNAAISELRAETKARQTRVIQRVAEVAKTGEATRKFYLTQGATAKDMQAWWDSRRP